MNREYYKLFFKPEFHADFDEFDDLSRRERDDMSEEDEQIYWQKFWNDGDCGDDSKVPYIVCAKGDDIWYCWNNGYVNTYALNEKFDALDEADQIRFVEEYCDYYYLR